METVIDWSKAPEWAEAYAQVIYEHETTAKDFAWVCADGYNVNPFGLTEQVCHPYMKEFFTVGRFRLIEFRPATDQAWTGEGLPPVGTVCEWAGCTLAPEDPDEPDLHIGDQVTIIAHFKDGEFDLAAFTFNPQIHNPDRGTAWVSQGAHACFRLNRTPEQIASDIRLKEINELAEYIAAWSCDTLPLPRHMHLAGHLYENRYRKQVAP